MIVVLKRMSITKALAGGEELAIAQKFLDHVQTLRHVQSY